MAKLIPERVKVTVEEEAFALLDQWKYLNRTRVENSQFMDHLAHHTELGQKLGQFLDAAAVRKYIKDVLVNKYAKSRRDMPRDIESQLSRLVNEPIHEVEWVVRDRLSLHRTASGKYIVTARTTFVKWETGLRKILFYTVDKPVLQGLSEVRKCLAVFEHGSVVNPTDRDHLQRALSPISVECVWGT